MYIPKSPITFNIDEMLPKNIQYKNEYLVFKWSCLFALFLTILCVECNKKRQKDLKIEANV